MKTRTISATIIAVVMLSFIANVSGYALPGQYAQRPTAAVSFSRLQIALQKGNAAADTLGGLNRIQGILYLPEQNDVIMVGQCDRNIPAIHADDIVVALRQAYLSENRIPIGVTIDPMQGIQDPWKLQSVGIFSMPPTCRMAKRMVDFDYELKKVGAGFLKMQHVPSSFDNFLSGGCSDGNGQKNTEIAHRFWFFPEPPEKGPRFRQCAQERYTVITRPVCVSLLSEKEFLIRTGERTGGTSPDASAQQFADAITNLLQGNDQHYAALVSDFRVIETAQLMKYMALSKECFGYLLSKYSVKRFDVPDVVAGIWREVTEQAGCEATIIHSKKGIELTEKGIRKTTSYRGGVEARIEVKTQDFSTIDQNSAHAICAILRKNMAATKNFIWRF